MGDWERGSAKPARMRATEERSDDSTYFFHMAARKRTERAGTGFLTVRRSSMPGGEGKR